MGPLTVPNRVFLAPMSGVTDAPFRRLAAKLGAGVVVSEMIASAALAEGRRDQQRRLRGEGLRLNVVQIAGCEAHWMAEGARIAEAAGADIIDINMGCPAKHVTGKESGLRADARPRSCADLDRCDGRRGERAGDAEDAARLGRQLAQCARACAPRRDCRYSFDHRARPHALPVLQRFGGLDRGARREAGRVDPGRRQWRCDGFREGASKR